MKKVCMFLLSATLVSSAFAQKGYDKHYDDHHNQQYNYGYNIAHERDGLIARINADYDNRIQRVEYDRFLRNHDKKRDIRQLEKQRKQELRDALARFDSKGRFYRDGMARNDRRY